MKKMEMLSEIIEQCGHAQTELSSGCLITSCLPHFLQTNPLTIFHPCSTPSGIFPTLKIGLSSLFDYDTTTPYLAFLRFFRLSFFAINSANLGN